MLSSLWLLAQVSFGFRRCLNESHLGHVVMSPSSCRSGILHITIGLLMSFAVAGRLGACMNGVRLVCGLLWFRWLRTVVFGVLLSVVVAAAGLSFLFSPRPLQCFRSSFSKTQNSIGSIDAV